MKKNSILLLTFLFSGIIQVNAQYSVIHNFSGGINGSNPLGSLTFLSGKLFGMASSGGAHDSGCIFSIDTNGSGYKDLFDFNGPNGSQPGGAENLTRSGKLFYGTTLAGGAYKSGCIFCIDTTGSSYRILHSFNGTLGNWPIGSLVISGSVLYGMTEFGGAYGQGCIFSIDTSGSGYKDLFDFSGVNGSQPVGSLTLSGTTLFGIADLGGALNYGCIFSIDTNGTGYQDLFDFAGIDGSGSWGSLLISGGVMYAMTDSGGAYNMGCIFSIDTDGSAYTDLFDFDSVSNGSHPYGALTFSGNVLYGMTSGYPKNYGSIFSIDTDGTGYANLFNFNITNGFYPTANLTILGNVMYGMTQLGGTNDSGVIFRFRDTIMPCINNYVQTICIVTTDTSIDKNVIIWGRNDSPANGSFNIYDSTASGWVLIGNVPDTSLSEYIDTASNPNAQPYSYCISTLDSCGESALSPTNASIYLQVLQELSGKDSLYWTPYTGFLTPYYLIYRGPALNALKLIDSATGGVQTYVDTLPPAGSIYLVEAINPSGGCTPTHKHITHGSSTSTFASLSNGGIPKKVTGIENIVYPKNTVIISPNPNNGWFTLQTTNIKSKSRIDVYNMFGEKIYTQGLNTANTQIDIGNNASGIYLYRVVTETGELVSEGKFVKE